jgi:hypothetical protein
MNEQASLIIYALVGIISIIIVICLFVLCRDVSKIKKNIGISDAEEYIIQKEIGNSKEAYYHLQRDFIIQSRKRDFETYEIREYYKKFTELGCGMPEFEQFKHLEQLGQLEQGRDGEWI